MVRLEDLQTGTRVRGLAPSGVATVKAVSWFGDQGVEVIFTDAQGALHQRLVYREDEASLDLVRAGRPPSASSRLRPIAPAIRAARRSTGCSSSTSRRC
jgi:hypothetical protein